MRGAYPVEYTARGWVYTNTGNPVAEKDIPSIINHRTPKTTRAAIAQGQYNAQVRAGLRNPAEDMIPIW